MKSGSSVALGTFDGLHKGHMKVLESALSSSGDGVVPFVLLFDCPPQKILSGAEPPCIMTDSDRNDFLREMGFQIKTVSFEELHNMSPEDFVKDILHDRLFAKTVCCGYNYRFGKGGCGDSEELSKLCKKYGIETVICDEQTVDGEPVSSTLIRKLISDGNMKKAEKLLGRPFSYTLEVIHGQQKGRLLGFPTANQIFPENFAIPKYGVYSSKTTIDGKIFKSITNIGISFLP